MHRNQAELIHQPAQRLQADGGEVIDVDNPPNVPQPAEHLEQVAQSTPPRGTVHTTTAMTIATFLQSTPL